MVALTVAPISELVSWTVGASVVTSTLLATVPICRIRLNTGCAPTLIVIPLLISVLNPVAETEIS